MTAVLASILRASSALRFEKTDHMRDRGHLAKFDNGNTSMSTWTRPQKRSPTMQSKQPPRASRRFPESPFVPARIPKSIIISHGMQRRAIRVRSVSPACCHRMVQDGLNEGQVSLEQSAPAPEAFNWADNQERPRYAMSVERSQLPDGRHFTSPIHEYRFWKARFIRSFQERCGSVLFARHCMIYHVMRSHGSRLEL